MLQARSAVLVTALVVVCAGCEAGRPQQQQQGRTNDGGDAGVRATRWTTRDGGVYVGGNGFDVGAVDGGRRGIADAGSNVGDAGASGESENEGGVVVVGNTDDGGVPLDAGFGPPLDAGFGPSGCLMLESTVAEQPTWHIDAGQEPEYTHNPPTSGPHWSFWARWSIHDSDVPPEVYVHNEEHGGVVFLVGPDATPAQVQAMKDIYNAMPIDPECADQGYAHKRITMGRDPDLDDVVAVVAWNHVLESSSCANGAQIRDFVLRHRAHSPEDNCWDSGF